MSHNKHSADHFFLILNIFKEFVTSSSRYTRWWRWRVTFLIHVHIEILFYFVKLFINIIIVKQRNQRIFIKETIGKWDSQWMLERTSDIPKTFFHFKIHLYSVEIIIVLNCIFLLYSQIWNQTEVHKNFIRHTFLDLTWLDISRQVASQVKSFSKKVKSSHTQLKKLQVKSSQVWLDLTWLDSSQKWLDLPISGSRTLHRIFFNSDNVSQYYC